MKETLQFSVTKLKDGSYRIIAQDYKEIVRSYAVKAKKMEESIVKELNALRPVDK